MKKILSLLLSITMLLSITAGMNITANAEVFSGYCGAEGDGSNLTWSLNENTKVLTISGTGEMMGYYSENEVPWNSRRYCIASVVINSGVTSIGDSAFENCDSLISITIPSSVTRIGDYAFRGCNSLTSITVDGSNQNYSSQDGVLFNKDKTVLIQYPIGNTRILYRIPNIVTSIGDWAFYGCNSLTSITMPNSVTSIGDCAFAHCDSLTSIEIPNSVTSIGHAAFWYCDSLTSIEIPNSVTSIGHDAFSNCYNLTSIEIPNSVTSIGDGAFSSCYSLTSITIPNSVTSIGGSAFEFCYSLTSIEIPNSVTSIGYGAFDECRSLTSITVDGNNQNYSSQDEVLFNKDKTVLIQYPIGNIRTSYTIPNSVTSIGDGAFMHCFSLTSITVDGNNQNYSSQDGVLFNKDKTVLIQYPIGNTRTSYTILNSVTSIGDYAFYDCNSLTSITIPNSVTRIGDSAFYLCSSLTSITIPNSVTSIGDHAFCFCSLTDVYYSGSDNEWNNISIGYSNDTLNNATIHYNSTGPENSGGSTGGGSIGGGGGGFVPATPEEPATTEPTTQPSTKPSAPATTTTKKPSTVKVEKVTKGTKSFKVTWKKKTGVSGYQVQYATDKKFKKNKKTVTVAKKNATSKTIKKLKSKKTYYVRVRTYKIVNGKKVYSSWSKVKAVKTK